MSILLLAAAAASAATPVHTVSYEQNGKTYSIDYVAHVEASSHLDRVSPAGRRRAAHCLTNANVTIERRITDAASGQTLSAYLPETNTVSQTQAGRCGNTAERTNDLLENRSDLIKADLVAAAAADKARLADTITAARSLAAR